MFDKIMELAQAMEQHGRFDDGDAYIICARRNYVERMNFVTGNFFAVIDMIGEIGSKLVHDSIFTQSEIIEIIKMSISMFVQAREEREAEDLDEYTEEDPDEYTEDE